MFQISCGMITERRKKMSDAFIGEVRFFPYQYVPDGWLPCDGQEYMQSQYAKLFSIIGEHYGTKS
ncbi:tail fiber protein, partial [Klebsiella pneumoniae]|uniref:tail fiber protein n=1 Tax=Klebsiella pneumoniae TaxID=573 RepID=UPI0038549495